MSIASFILERVGLREQAAPAAPLTHDYGDVWKEDGHTYVRAHSGPDAASRFERVTAEGENYFACNHLGGGVYEIVIESW